MSNFLYFVDNPLHAMIPLSLELMGINRDCVSSFMMICQTFTTAVFLPLVLSSASEMHAQSLYPYTLQNSSGCFCLLSRHQ